MEQPILSLLSPNDSIVQKFVERVQGDYDASKNFVREKHSQFIEYLERYYNRKDDKRPAGLANCPVPLTKEAINVVVADIVDKLYGSFLQIDVAPREREDEFSAAAIRDVVRYQADARKWKRKMRRAVQTALLFGVSPAKVWYTEERRKFIEYNQVPDATGLSANWVQSVADKVIYRGAEFEPIDIFDFFPHPAMVDVQDDLSVIHRFMRSPLYLIARQKQGLFENVDLVMAELRQLDDQNTYHETDERFKRERREIVMNTTAGAYDVSGTNFVRCFEWQGTFDINDDGIDEQVIGVVADVGGKYIPLRMDENPYVSGEKTYICGKLYEQEGEFWGIGLADALGTQQEAATSLMNATIDAYVKLARPRIYARKSALQDPSQVTKPWGVVDIIDEERPMSDCVQEMPPLPIGTDGLNLLQIIKNDAQAASGVVDIKAGRAQGGMTATVGNYVYQQASIIFKDILSQFEESFVIPLCDKANEINAQFIDQPYATMIIGESGRYWKTYRPEELAGKVHFISLASMKNADRTIKGEQLARAMQIMGSNPQMAAAMPMIVTEWWKNMELPELEKLKILIGYYPMMMNAMAAQDNMILPYQQLALQNQTLGLGQQPMAAKQPQGNEVPYTTSQQSAPVNNEEMNAAMNAANIRNMPNVQQ